MMPGVSFEEICTAIEDSYTYNELARLVRTAMDTRLDLVTAPGNFREVVFDLLQWAERNDREVELVRAVARARPGHDGMQRIYKLYGMGILVSVRQTGIPVPGAPRDASEAGLEAKVKPYTGFRQFEDWRKRLTEIEGQVCRITIGGHSAGTGFMVGPEAVLTNYHVLRDIEGLEGHTPSSEVLCEFDYKKLKTGARSLTPVKLHPTSWLIDFSKPTPSEDSSDADGEQPTMEQLDYALIRLENRFGERPADPHPGKDALPRGWVSVPLAEPDYRSPMPVLIPQHPDGQPLILALDTEAINKDARPPYWLNANKTRIRYSTNTESGSSGSPCFDFDWNLLALHHYGDGGYGAGAGYNQGIPIIAIRRRLERNPELEAALGS